MLRDRRQAPPEDVITWTAQQIVATLPWDEADARQLMRWHLIPYNGTVPGTGAAAP